MQIVHELKYNFDDVLIKPKRSQMASRSLIELERSFTTLNSKRQIKGVPIIAANMDSTGTMEICQALSEAYAFTCLHKFYPVEKLINFYSCNPASEYAFYTTGITDADLEKLYNVSDVTGKVDKICIDVANGYTEYFQGKVMQIREKFPEAVIMAGNVATPEMVSELLLSGAADIVKIGIGPGSVCSTRKVTGVGYPQLSAIIECADCAHGLGGLICADGGCKTAGDVAKSFGAGADFTMLGGMFAGCDECEGERVEGGFKFYGMSSKEAMDKYCGGMASYRASEGECRVVPFKGPVKNVLEHILGGLRSTCAYVGASTLKDLSKCTTFVRCASIK